MTDQHQVDWDTLLGDTDELKVPVSLFILCKTIVEDESGSLFLNATVVQRVQVGNFPVPNPPDPPSRDSTTEQLTAVMFGIDLKGPFPGGEVKPRRDASLTEVGARPSSTWLCAQTFDLVSVPIDVRSVWHRFPFRILQGTVELELKTKSASFGGGRQTDLCPTLFVSDPEVYPDNVVAARPLDHFDRSRTLAVLLGKPTIEILDDVRWKKGAKESHPEDHPRPNEDDLFITFPLMRLTFWFHEPTSKAVFKGLGPLLLVVTLMWVNFHEFFGIFDIWDGCPDRSRYSDYLTNGIGIAITAVFMIPLIRAETRNSHHDSFTSDDYVALAFLVGLGASTLRNCAIAFMGCFISSIVVIGAMGSLVAHHFECSKIRRMARELLHVPVDSNNAQDRVKLSAQNFTSIQWIDAAEYNNRPEVCKGRLEPQAGLDARRGLDEQKIS